MPVSWAESRPIGERNARSLTFRDCYLSSIIAWPPSFRRTLAKPLREGWGQLSNSAIKINL